MIASSPSGSEFQSTHPRGVRQPYPHNQVNRTKFQSTHPRGVRLSILQKNISKMSFNPRTHEGCDNRWFDSYKDLTVSIHAPTRGATEGHLRKNVASNVSIHAPTRGATSLSALWAFAAFVSIHAPTRGATSSSTNFLTQTLFQSTHPRGVRLIIIYFSSFKDCFNPRTHEGCD